MLVPALFVFASYLWGSIPTAYLVARYRSGIDIRDYGSGNVGATNVMEHSGKLTGLLVGTFDSIGKGALPIVVAALIGFDPYVQATSGLAAIVGHNWSPFLRFTGGRGVATAIGTSLAFQLWYEAVIVAVVLGVIGRIIFHETGLWTFVSLITIPVLVIAFGRPSEALYLTVGFGVLLLLKRLTANFEPLPKDRPWYRVMGYRILWDRDVPKKDEWTERQPRQNDEGSFGHVSN